MRTSCIRCGKCCTDGGPALHSDDRRLVEQKIIPLQHLFTIREGEPAWDNVQSQFVWVSSDIIKIKGKGSSWECYYFDSDEKRCRIYEDRPLECRKFKCWDTSEAEAIIGTGYLARTDLLSSVKGLWDLILEHQQQCSYNHLRDMIKDNPDLSMLQIDEQIRKMITYDSVTRSKTIDLVKVDPQWLEFLFGQPLSTVIQRVMTKKPIESK